MSAYIDSSVVVSFLLLDSQHQRARQAVASLTTRPCISTWTLAEFASAARRMTREKRLPPMALPSVFKAFDAWCRRVDVHPVSDGDVLSAYDLLRDGTEALKAPDALHVAICRRIGRTLLTFDTGLETAARSMGIDVASA